MAGSYEVLRESLQAHPACSCSMRALLFSIELLRKHARMCKDMQAKCEELSADLRKKTEANDALEHTLANKKARRAP